MRQQPQQPHYVGAAAPTQTQVASLGRQLLQERTKVRALSDELETPLNVHRWDTWLDAASFWPHVQGWGLGFSCAPLCTSPSFALSSPVPPFYPCALFSSACVAKHLSRYTNMYW